VARGYYDTDNTTAGSFGCPNLNLTEKLFVYEAKQATL
jgi:hypothetical protein